MALIATIELIAATAALSFLDKSDDAFVNAGVFFLAAVFLADAINTLIF